MLSGDIRELKQGDKLLREPCNSEYGVEYINDPISRLIHIWDGFITTGDKIAELCLSGEMKFDRHTLIFPMLYNYRHSIELALKLIINNHSSDDKFNIHTHNLRNLWNKFESILHEYKINMNDDPTVYIARDIVLEFDSIDNKSDAFRYGESSNGMLFDIKIDKIDINNLRNIMKGMDFFFNGIMYQLEKIDKYSN